MRLFAKHLSIKAAASSKGTSASVATPGLTTIKIDKNGTAITVAMREEMRVAMEDEIKRADQIIRELLGR